MSDADYIALHGAIYWETYSAAYCEHWYTFDYDFEYLFDVDISVDAEWSLSNQNDFYLNVEGVSGGNATSSTEIKNEWSWESSWDWSSWTESQWADWDITLTSTNYQDLFDISYEDAV